jgi:hypothetical protein
MPSKSKAQHNLMAAVANNPAFAKKVGIKKSVGEEFMKADKTKKFGSGGALKEVDSSDNPGLSKLPTEVRNKMGYMKKGGMAKSCATKSDAKMIAKKEVKGHESSMHKMKKGGIVEKGTGEKYASKAAMMRHEKKESKTEEMKEHGMKKGGVAKTVTKEMEYDYKTGKKSFAGSTAKRDQHAEKEGKIVAKHLAYDKAKGMKSGGSCSYASGGKVSQLAKANGIAKQGKTRGKII